ncbi:purine-binding chemotaxis protein CheW [bacterium]|nr:MAG: purine-binding chemotaxis protein CheW [bacterium]
MSHNQNMHTDEVFDEVHKLISSLLTREITPEQQEKVLLERAVKLKKVEKVEDTGEKMDVVIFQLGSDLFALEAQYIHEIRQIGEITPVPCTPDFVLGITSVRGSIYSALDIRKSFSADEKVVSPESMFILTIWNKIEVCLLVDSVLEKRGIPKRDIKPIVTGSKNANLNYVIGFVLLNEKMVTLIDWNGFIAHANIVVNEEV